jgi:FtsZ-interacting cell division protein YlmF
MNAHLGLDLGSRRCVFFIHGGITMLRGQIHNLDASIPATNADNTSGTTEVVVRQDPNAKAVGPSLKLGLIVYIR